ncbi:HEAT repeat domain-containing protein [Photobacterium aquae]|uniref:HEAT repeat domain-containing protein n=1 Tax=Photobacterium aquae TaxID=1195763 RepID=UPI00069D3BA8|nr:HEAT repeat domain-containing protein [Photobacterium aquae]
MKVWLILQTLTFEAISFYFVFEQPETQGIWLVFIANHAIACGSFTALCWLLLPRKYKSPIIGSLSFLFFFNLFLPLIGMIGTSCSLLIALYLPREQSNVTWQECEKSPLPQHPGDGVGEKFGAGALREILLHNSEPDRRLLAVAAVRNLPRQHAVPLLQLALKDLTDDVRLLAYASLEAIETQINETIALLKKQFEHKATQVKAYEIAQQYWELCYLGIAEGILKTHYLKQAEYYLNEANDIKVTASANLLLGRVLLSQERPEDAVPVLKVAMDGGLLLKQVAPYLAEAAYLSDDYTLARHYIDYFPTQKGGRLSQIKEYWK